MTSPPAPQDPDRERAPVDEPAPGGAVQGEAGQSDAAHGDAPAQRRLGDPTDERPIPRGCHPLVFGVVMATLQFGCTVYFMRTC